MDDGAIVVVVIAAGALHMRSWHYSHKIERWFSVSANQHKHAVISCCLPNKNKLYTGFLITVFGYALRFVFFLFLK